MTPIAKRKDDGLVNAGVIFFLGTIFTSLFSYMYHLFMGRMLGPADYGILGSLFSIIYIATYASQTFMLTVSKFVSAYMGRGKMQEAKGLVLYSAKKLFSYGGLALLAYLALVPLISSYLNIQNQWYVAMVGAIAYLIALWSGLVGALNGFQMFIEQNIANVVQTFLKFTLAVAFVLIGYGLYGALGSLLIGTLVSVLYSSYVLFKAIAKVKEKRIDTGKLYRYMIPAFLSLFLSVSIISVDKMLVKHYFPSVEAGYYSAAWMIAMTVWLGSGFLSYALFPKIAALHESKKKTSALLCRAMCYTALLASIGCMVLFLLPGLAVKLLYGNDYMASAGLIGLFGLGFGLYSLSFVLVNYFMAVESYAFIWLLSLSLLLEILGIWLFHAVLLEVVLVFLFVNIVIFIGLIIYYRNI